jgi:hypothetical protein
VTNSNNDDNKEEITNFLVGPVAISSDNFSFRVDILGRPLRRPLEPHLPRPTRRPDSDGDRGDPLRLHPPVHHAQILEGEALLPPVQVRLGQRDPRHRDEPEKSTPTTLPRALSLTVPLQVDFFWINRNQRSFEWFVNLLSQLEIEQAELGGAMERFLEMHMYITSALQKTDMKAVGLQLALDLLHEKVSRRDRLAVTTERSVSGKEGFDYRIEDENQRRQAQLGQSVQTNSRPKER